MAVEVTLGFSVFEGKTYAARVTGRDPKYGLARSFVPAASRHRSRSGRTATNTYLLEPGIYELSDEGRRRYVAVGPDGTLTRLADATAALAALAEGVR